MIKKFSIWLKDNGWKVIKNKEKYSIHSNKVLNKFQGLPSIFIEFIEEFKRMESNDETIWFLCGDDYSNESDDAFKWNEFELMSLEASQGDEEWQNEILEWWSDKLPIILSVRNGYSFYAIDMGTNKGAIIKGEEPEFENTMVIADSFEGFLNGIMNGTIQL